MTRKKFIKTLRSYRLHRDDINHLVNKIVERKGKLSYNDAMDKMFMTICKLMLPPRPKPIDWVQSPVPFIDTDIYKFDYNIMGMDLSIKPDKYVNIRSVSDK